MGQHPNGPQAHGALIVLHQRADADEALLRHVGVLGVVELEVADHDADGIGRVGPQGSVGLLQGRDQRRHASRAAVGPKCGTV